MHSQYVSVATNQKEVMMLGGNLPDSLSQYLHPGHDTKEQQSESKATIPQQKEELAEEEERIQSDSDNDSPPQKQAAATS